MDKFTYIGKDIQKPHLDEIIKCIREFVYIGKYLYNEEGDSYSKSNYKIVSIVNYKEKNFYGVTLKSKRGHNYIENIFSYDIEHSLIKQRIRDNKLKNLLE